MKNSILKRLAVLLCWVYPALSCPGHIFAGGHGNMVEHLAGPETPRPKRSCRRAPEEDPTPYLSPKAADLEFRAGFCGTIMHKFLFPGHPVFERLTGAELLLEKIAPPERSTVISTVIEELAAQKRQILPGERPMTYFLATYCRGLEILATKLAKAPARMKKTPRKPRRKRLFAEEHGSAPQGSSQSV